MSAFAVPTLATIPTGCLWPTRLTSSNAARPQTQERIRWEDDVNLLFPDRSEYFWARANGGGKGPAPVAPFAGPATLNNNQLSLYTETAINNAGIFVEVPYRELDTDSGYHAAGFSDMNVGIKTLLFDCELLQLATQFRTWIPTGNFRKGIGDGHVSLEPGLIASMQLSKDQYLQGEIQEWIPIGGDQNYEGSVFLVGLSYNCVLWRFVPDVLLVGTLEYTSISYQTGLYTDPYGGIHRASGETCIGVGPGIRLFVCDKIDFGVGSNFGVTDDYYAREVFRTEFRVRY